MRGNHGAGARDFQLLGSIPAHAGEPLRATLSLCLPRVYPRACGGTAALAARMRGAMGLSPRMRGNPGPSGEGFQRVGSIPAHAGEPVFGICPQARNRVYPRACGGTATATRRATRIRGLSPRMRGNRPCSLHDHFLLGSIPAHAGEPIPPKVFHGRGGVYPRACGGTLT